MEHKMKPFSCSFPGCNSSYQRKEHLQRHLVQHSAETRNTHCPFCDRTFARHDTMRRHARQVHQTEAKRLCDIRAERTCKACRIAKSSCEGRNPCRRCFHEGLDCSLSSDRISRRSPGTDNTIKVNSSIHRYTQRYFQHCHPQWPILHPSTFSIRDEPSLLLYSVVAIGLWTDNTPSSRSMASALHAKLGDSIRQQKSQWDGTVMHNNQDGHPASAWPIATYQGILLYLVLALRRSRQRLLNRSDYDILLTLVETCRRHNLFFYPRMAARYQGINSIACIWVGVEEIKRFGIALYRVCQLCCNGNSSNVDDECGPFEHDLLTLSDLRFPMPESDELWNAASNMALSNELADRNPKAALDGRRLENWISNLGELCSDDLIM